jgi:3-deoxy-manno-octulosonate cytidylyltransferase (CMP-KDO synthetase)
MCPKSYTEIIVELAKHCKDHHVLTAYTDMNSVDRANPDSVKLIHNGSKAKWFCRASLDYGDHHLGVYAYSRVALLEYPNLVKTKEEEIEKLEQLRWLQNNIDIGIVKVDFDGIEINTPEDLEKWHKQNSH